MTYVADFDEDFNSIKVRLKPSPCFRELAVCKFQFHKGTIKTHTSQHCLHAYTLFQFHKGTIKTKSETPKAGRPAIFQFHKGTIKTNAQSKYLAK